MLGAIIVLLIRGLIWGFATQAIIENKGYSENWFWWGFFFGIIAMLVALSKPAVPAYDFSDIGLFSEEKNKTYVRSMVETGGWQCHFCNRANPSYTGTCACGRTKEDTLAFEAAKIEQMKKAECKNSEEDSLDKIKKLKELLDIGALTQEEFDEKKKEFLL
ncbi:MAG: SHOCT domain-containing protein [Lachnospiraceae bacterium]|nr:SHOCT domain-containing protein [Lachnospiraceae bacterium]